MTAGEVPAPRRKVEQNILALGADASPRAAMLIVRLPPKTGRQDRTNTATRKISGRMLAGSVLTQAAMTLNNRLAKLREQQRQITESIREAEAQASVRQRKEETRAKIILGGALMSMPTVERDAMMSMFLDRMPERDRRFVSEHLAGHQPEPPSASDAQQPS